MRTGATARECDHEQDQANTQLLLKDSILGNSWFQVTASRTTATKRFASRDDLEDDLICWRVSAVRRLLLAEVGPMLHSHWPTPGEAADKVDLSGARS